ncbi:MAG: FHA domain-containing protein [Kiritimatiellae bacterium]|jgi:pSer/pThr/pTyr-binding forkhead associated (FHA) protein|nr:FHA domain-containing protein [Kiritimatiellia bacterium]
MSVHLLITAGKDLGRKISISKVGTKVGRSTSGNDLVIIDDMLSRQHCRFYFENDLLHVEDLDSANGTLVDDVEIKSKQLFPGNEVLLGDTILKVVSNRLDGTVVDEQPQSDNPAKSGPKPLVDLGFNSSRNAANTQSSPSALGKKPLGFLLVIVVLLLLVVWGPKILKSFSFKSTKGQVAEVLPLPAVSKHLLLNYEKVQASPENIFRYYLTLDADTNLTVEIDDLINDRHVSKNVVVDNPEYIGKIIDGLRNSGIYGLDEKYQGLSGDDSIESYELSITIGLDHKTIKVYNRVEPEEFKAARETIEEFAKNELGIWAIQFSKEKLLELAEDAYLNGQKLYNEKQVDYANLSESIVFLKQSEWYLETVDPKPDYYGQLIRLLNDGEVELQQKYDDQNFNAERAMKLKEWTIAKQELEQIIAMIPNRSDERNIEARRKLIDVKRRIETEQ